MIAPPAALKPPENIVAFDCFRLQKIQNKICTIRVPSQLTDFAVVATQ